MNPALLEIIKQCGTADILRELRDYCAERSNEASRDGFSGMAWYDLSQSIDGIVPELSDEQMDNEPEGGY
ncbi:hypothetical protein UFOVP408_41 [uncultured Caudovirales phage]|uniref:Uncharacterized protein n=1 Tax=uncultured Caudovirales phage TaxID=2100421 RepID=A0A6J5NHD4_9CAUD|nr:hypothetical protein UFOVP356_52 [uncultured Caudovirales phage]CAB4140589.1 hypothetical protein UFOVP408_41 [uncultured Caudovirales phage]CAB4156921.1 hypothetical protein UFOVP676_32 [uncultured Caudovirales phage]